jgi:hypothetical protein
MLYQRVSLTTTVLKLYFTKRYALEVDAEFPIGFQREEIKDITPAAKSYYPLIRALQKLYNVRCLRNQYNIEEGIYVVGRKKIREAFIDRLRKIIQSVERDVAVYRFRNQMKKETGEHLATAIMKFRKKRIKRYVTAVTDMQALKIKKGFCDMGVEIQDSFRHQDLIKQEAALKTKKQFK